MLMGHSDNANNMLQDPQRHKSSLTHEVIAGAAAYEAMKAYEKKRAQEGHHDHSTAREIIAAIAGAEVDKKFETGGLDWLDKEEAKRQAQQHAVAAYDQQYAGGGGY